MGAEHLSLVEEAEALVVEGRPLPVEEAVRAVGAHIWRKVVLVAEQREAVAGASEEAERQRQVPPSQRESASQRLVRHRRDDLLCFSPASSLRAVLLVPLHVAVSVPPAGPTHGPSDPGHIGRSRRHSF